MEKLKLKKFDNQQPVVSAVWLREEVAKIRPGGVSTQGFSKLRKDAQLMVDDGDGNLIPNAARDLTQQEAARLVFVALYKPNGKPLVKTIINGPNLKDIKPLDLRNWFDLWASIGAPYGVTLLEKILLIPVSLTVGEFQASAEKLGMPVALKEIRRVLKWTGRAVKKAQLNADERGILMIWLFSRSSELKS